MSEASEPRERFVPRALRALRAASSSAARESARTFFKEKVAFLGVPVPALRRIARDLAPLADRGAGIAAALDACEPLLAEAQQEPRTLALLLCERWKARLDASFLRRAFRWLAEGRCDNWALVDALCIGSLGPLLARRPELAVRLASWPSSRNRWMRRASLAALIPAVRRGALLSQAYATADRLLGDGDDLVRKATGWLLREAGRTDARRLEIYLRERGPRLPRTALRTAIERFPDARRRDLLRATRIG
ncbi:MAG: DNA alkylation repair protein [Planctomycetaceae bacterium]